jgi:hypothetical protein
VLRLWRPACLRSQRQRLVHSSRRPHDTEDRPKPRFRPGAFSGRGGDALEADGFVSRAAHPTDRRATLVALTPKGKAFARRMQHEYRDLAKTLFADFRSDKLAELLRMLDLMLDRLRSAGLDGTPAVPADRGARAWHRRGPKDPVQPRVQPPGRNEPG